MGWMASSQCTSSLKISFSFFEALFEVQLTQEPKRLSTHHTLEPNFFFLPVLAIQRCKPHNTRSRPFNVLLCLPTYTKAKARGQYIRAFYYFDEYNVPVASTGTFFIYRESEVCWCNIHYFNCHWVGNTFVFHAFTNHVQQLWQRVRDEVVTEQHAKANCQRVEHGCAVSFVCALSWLFFYTAHYTRWGHAVVTI